MSSSGANTRRRLHDERGPHGPQSSRSELGYRCGAGAAGGCGGRPPQRVEYPIDESFVDEFLTDLCGTTVTVSSTGTLHVTLWRNADGLVVSELDRYPNTWRTFKAENGSSFRIRLHAVQRLIYDGGARVGSLVRIETTGMFAHYPGIAFAGHATELAEVQGLDENGVPIIDFDTLIMQRLVGHNPDVDAAPAICEALS